MEFSPEAPCMAGRTWNCPSATGGASKKLAAARNDTVRRCARLMSEFLYPGERSARPRHDKLPSPDVQEPCQPATAVGGTSTWHSLPRLAGKRSTAARLCRFVQVYLSYRRFPLSGLCAEIRLHGRVD